jgi:hypothetical protein
VSDPAASRALSPATRARGGAPPSARLTLSPRVWVLPSAAAARRTVALVTMVVTLYFFYVMYNEFMRVYFRFRVPPTLLITGRFDTFAAFFEMGISAADLRGANDAHSAQQTIRQQMREFLIPLSYAKVHLEEMNGPEPSERGLHHSH